MTSSLHGTTDVTTMTLAFPSQPMMHEGPQSLKTLLTVQQHIINCAQSFAVDGRPFGLLNLAVPHQLYALYTAAQWIQEHAQFMHPTQERLRSGTPKIYLLSITEPTTMKNTWIKH